MSRRRVWWLRFFCSLFILFHYRIAGETETTTVDEVRSVDDNCLDEAEAEDMILKNIMNKYNKQAIPNKLGVDAEVEMHINDIPNLSELQSDFTLDLMYSEMWKDPRLAYKNLEAGKCVPNITLDLDYLKRIWTPNTCIVNSKSAVIHESPSLNVFLILYDDGTVWRNCRMMVRAPCEINLRLFPFDTQTCLMTFESYSYNAQKVRLRWFSEKAITFVRSVNLPDFTLVDYKAQRKTVAYPNGNWDQLKATFRFRRRSGFFILQAYVPTYMTIFVAWINFWMDPSDQLATRATLGISAFLAITLQFGNILKNQPPVSYVKAMDVWMLGCIIFLFGTLAELAVISHILRRDRPKNSAAFPARAPFIRPKPRPRSDSADGARILTTTANGSLVDPTTTGGDPERPSLQQPTFRQTASEHFLRFRQGGGVRTALHLNMYIAYKIDKACLIGFPPLFIAFNIFYWCYYVSYGGGFDDSAEATDGGSFTTAS